MVNKGLHQLKLKLLNKQLGEDLPSGEQLFKRLAEVWEEFFNQILPIIECAFYRLRARTAFLLLSFCFSSRFCVVEHLPTALSGDLQFASCFECEVFLANRST